jgi:hypothetical protein
MAPLFGDGGNVDGHSVVRDGVFPPASTLTLTFLYVP